MSKLGDALTLRLTKPDEHAELEGLQRRASLELPEYRDQLLANLEAIHLPPAQIANGQVIVAEFGGGIVGFAAVVGGELDGLFVEPDLWGRGSAGRAPTRPRTKRASAAWPSRSRRTRARGCSTRAAAFRSKAKSRRASARRSG